MVSAETPAARIRAQPMPNIFNVVPPVSEFALARAPRIVSANTLPPNGDTPDPLTGTKFEKQYQNGMQPFRTIPPNFPATARSGIPRTTYFVPPSRTHFRAKTAIEWSACDWRVHC